MNFDDFSEFSLELLAALKDSENFQNLQEALKEAILRDSSDLSDFSKNYTIHKEDGNTYLIPLYGTLIYEIIFDNQGLPIKLIEEDLLEV